MRTRTRGWVFGWGRTLSPRRRTVSYGLYSYGLYSYGLYSYGLYSYGLYSYGLWKDIIASTSDLFGEEDSDNTRGDETVLGASTILAASARPDSSHGASSHESADASKGSSPASSAERKLRKVQQALYAELRQKHELEVERNALEMEVEIARERERETSGEIARLRDELSRRVAEIDELKRERDELKHEHDSADTSRTPHSAVVPPHAGVLHGRVRAHVVCMRACAHRAHACARVRARVRKCVRAHCV